MSAHDVVVPGWPPPKGFSNGRIGSGRVLHVAGQIGCTPDGEWPKSGLLDSALPAQFGLALDNVIAVVRAAGGKPEDIAEMTVFVTSMITYRAIRKELGPIWRERLGKHYPAMALVAVEALFEKHAEVEIQAVAYLGDAP
jgi:enamine deaminase RidA (YjgF/YER057c/UK114 family)